MAENYKRLVAIPASNKGLTIAGNSAMTQLLGNPRSSYSNDCQAVTNAALKGRIVTASVGPFRVTGLNSAVESLKAVFAEVKAKYPELYAQLGTAGMLCARLVRGSKSSISNHSWGTAIDITIGGQLAGLGQAKAQYGMTLIAPIFNKHGWIWGGAFTRPDTMHFEAGKALVASWVNKTAAVTAVAKSKDLAYGDRSPEVAEVQRMLNKLGEKLAVDGIFGNGTRAAVLSFQAKNGLKADGIVGPKTLAKLKEKAK